MSECSILICIYTLKFLIEDICNGVFQIYTSQFVPSYQIVNILKIPVLCLYNLVIKLVEYGLLPQEKWIFRKYEFYSVYYDHLINFLKTPVLCKYNLVIKLFDCGLLLQEKWIFRKHVYYSIYYDIWYIWKNCSNRSLMIRGIHQITGIKSGWLENCGWYKCIIERLNLLMTNADNFTEQFASSHSMEFNGFNSFFGELLSSTIFVYEYLINVTVCLGVLGTIYMISKTVSHHGCQIGRLFYIGKARLFKLVRFGLCNMLGWDIIFGRMITVPVLAGQVIVI